MFKGFSRKQSMFNGFPNAMFRGSSAEYGFSGVVFNIDAEKSGKNTETDLAALSYVTDTISGQRFSQSTAGNQPRYKTSDANFNNQPVIDFYDINRWMTSTYIFPTANYFTWAWCCKINAINTFYNSLLGNATLSVNEAFVACENATGVSPYGAGFISSASTGRANP